MNYHSDNPANYADYNNSNNNQKTKSWYHGPNHLFDSPDPYMITASTLHHQHIFRSEDKLNFIQNKLFELAVNYRIIIDAWAIFSNHYHIIIQSKDNTHNFSSFISNFHTVTARKVNEIDQCTNRQVWYQYWDTKLTFNKSYLARLNYVHQNAVKHKLVVDAKQYPWCSAYKFENDPKGTTPFYKKVKTFRFDKIKIEGNID